MQTDCYLWLKWFSSSATPTKKSTWDLKSNKFFLKSVRSVIQHDLSQIWVTNRGRSNTFDLSFLTFVYDVCNFKNGSALYEAHVFNYWIHTLVMTSSMCDIYCMLVSYFLTFWQMFHSQEIVLFQYLLRCALLFAPIVTFFPIPQRLLPLSF